MKRNKDIENLPINFRHEKQYILINNLDSWEKLKDLSTKDINKIIVKSPLCTESRLIKIRAIATFIFFLDLTPQEGYLLLHCGVGSMKALSILNPHNLEKNIGRLERSLKIKMTEPINLIKIKHWISKAKFLEDD
mgnify:FL=1